MQFKAIIAVLSVAAMASATPAKTKTATASASPTPSGVTCANGFQAKCCQSVQNQVIGLVTVPVGINCVDLITLGGGQCRQTTACCQSGDQAGLINVGNVCPVILG